MKRILPVLMLLAAAGMAIQAQDALPEARMRALGEDLIVREIAPGVWVHISVKPDASGRPIPSNGLLVVTQKLSVLIDAGWEPDQARRLLEWSETELRRPVQHVIVTHAHPDRIGGLEAIQGRPIIVHGHEYTSRLARLFGAPMFHWTFRSVERLNLGGEIFDLLYPGPGHAPDNIVVYLPRRRVLFGGCLVRSAGAKNLGNLRDANLKTWPMAVRRVIESYRDAGIVVPGHGPPAGVELLSHTMELLEQETQRRSQPPPPATTP